MPNVKLFVDERHYETLKPKLAAFMPKFRQCLCRELDVPLAACQLAVLPVQAVDEQPEINCEIQYLALPHRTPDVVLAALEVLRDDLYTALGFKSAMRAAPLDPAQYVALKL